MTEKPITFSAPMVRAILAGRKTQTRRIIKWPAWVDDVEQAVLLVRSPPHAMALMKDGRPTKRFALRYQPGAHLWVRETWAPCACSLTTCSGTIFRADEEPAIPIKWRAPMFLRRADSRITLLVTEVRVQRLQEISEADAEAEGASSLPRIYGYQHQLPGWAMDWSAVGTRSKGLLLTESDICLSSARMAFGNAWNSIHGDGAWKINPLVAAITFRLLDGREHDEAPG